VAGHGPISLWTRALLCVVALLLGACSARPTDVIDDARKRRRARAPGRIKLPNKALANRADARPGLRRLRIDELGEAWLFVPESYDGSRAPLAVMLHGAGGDARGALRPFAADAERRGLLLLSPKSVGRTWDVIAGGFGPDVRLIERALELVLSRYAVDRSRLAIEGFSDGASYALSLGITNGDVFPYVIAFSPGFAAPAGRRGSPAMFVSHGKQDRVLPIDRTSRALVPRLKDAGYDVTYREFAGGHVAPRALAREALAWWLER
jgi:phospholipase/carboxylesterase